MSNDINASEGKVLEVLNNKVDLDGGNFKGSELEKYIHGHCSAFNLFDTRITDHILEGDELRGWALQGTYISKETYPDFYNKCLEEFKDESNTESKIKTNIEIVGTLTNNDEVFSSFATTSYIKTTIPMAPNNSTWEVQFEATTGSDISTKQILFGGSDKTIRSFHIGMDNGKWSMDIGAGSSWIATTITNNIAVATNTKYLLKATYDRNEYILQGSTDNGSTWVEFAKYASTTPIANMTETKFGVGRDYASPFLGSINLNKAYFNIANERIWTGVESIFKNPNGHKFYPIFLKPQIDEIYNQYGIADFYGIDEENERIFLPRNKYFALTGGVMGNGMTLGLTDGTNNVGLFPPNAHYENNSANAYGVQAGTSLTQSGWITNKSLGITTDPTNSGIALEANENKYLYYCVGNTEVTQAITNVTEVTTSENDTIPLFTGMYFDFKPNNVSWLKAGQRQNNAGVYKTCYDELVKAVNGTNPYDLKVINNTHMVNGINYDEYWILDQDNMTFRTPLTIATKSLSGTVVGNGLALGLTDGTENYGLSTRNINSNGGLGATTSGWGQPVGTATSGFTLNAIATGVTTDSTKSGIIAEQSTAQLYFKVANAVQNLELLDAGEVLEGLADKLDRSNKEEIVSWGMPDYVSGILISVTSTTSFIAPCDGCLFGQFNWSGTNEGKFYINGQYVGHSDNGTTGHFYLIAKGDVLTVTGTENDEVYFCPLKGVK
ncbi:MAG: hypothetical protein IKU37_09020 [Candidatus Gastranaerophilales bacterium]|nr:hypothetical protein [Candidatus Gastranaerophilales bacterium]